MNTPAAARLLIVDDDVELCTMLCGYLEHEGFQARAVHDGASALTILQQEPMQAVILDVGLPGIDGLEVLRQLRARSPLPVLMLSARGADVDRVVGIELGADDYLPKPFLPRELLARLRALLRRSGGKPTASVPEPPRRVLGLEVDLSQRRVTRDAVELPLTSTEFDLLEALLQANGAVRTKQQLTGSVLGRAYTSFDRSIDMHVANLRRKLGALPDGAERIETVRGVGYRLARGPGAGG